MGKNVRKFHGGDFFDSHCIIVVIFVVVELHSGTRKCEHYTKLERISVGAKYQTRHQ